MKEKPSTPISSPEITAEEYCEYIREITESALQYFGKLTDSSLLTDSWLKEFADKLSTSPAKVHKFVNANSLSLMCGRFSQELQRCLLLVGLDTTLQGSTYQQAKAEHIYLQPENTSYDMIIDPTIGQFVVGHNHVFVGTRQQLKDLLLNQTGHENTDRLQSLQKNPELLFEIMWGTNSKPLSLFTNTSFKPVTDLNPSQLIINNHAEIRKRPIINGTPYSLITPDSYAIPKPLLNFKS